MSELSLDEINTGKRFPYLVHIELQRNYKEMSTTLKSISESLIGGKNGLVLKTTDDSDFYCSYDWETYTKIGTVGVKVTMNHILDKVVQRVRCPFVKSGKIGRRYNVSENKETLHLEWDTRPTNPESASATKMVNQKGTQERLRSGSVDLIVEIGSGLDMKQFECDSMILALTSSKLDAMVCNTDSGKLLFPNMNPDGWESFYECIHPRNNGMTLAGVYVSPRDGIIEQVLPWFQTFHMEKKHVKFCQQLLDNMIDANEQFFYIEDPVGFGTVTALTDILELAANGNLEMIKRRTETALRRLITSDRMMKYYYVLDIKLIKRIIFLCLPIQKDRAGVYTSNSCPVLWNGLRSLINGHLQSLSVDKVIECEMFSHFVYNAILIESGRRRDFDSMWKYILEVALSSD